MSYTIKIIPADKKRTVKSFRLPDSYLKAGAIGLVAALLLSVGAMGFTFTSLTSVRTTEADLENLRQVNTLQQEQLLRLADKVAAIQGKEEELTRLEEEIRRLAAGAQTQTEDTAEEPGRGGPYSPPKAEILSLSESISFLERGLSYREESLRGLHREIKARRDRYLAFSGLVLSGAGGATPSIWPASGVVSSPFGYRWEGTDFHPGIDIANDLGTPIVATADGVIDYAGWNAGGYGNMVDIDHGGGLMTRYAHASQVIVSPGQRVRKGQIIALMGSTGFSTGPHVHYEVRINGQAVNPVSYL